MEDFEAKYLTGKCLIATPSMKDSSFEKAVIYVCTHSKDGAMGFVVNKTIKAFSFADLAMQMPIDVSKPIMPIDLYQGGPLDKVRGFVLHSTDYMSGDSIEPGGGIAISSSMDILTEIAFGSGPKENLIALGYASWAPQQLEKEIMQNCWMVAEASPELIFRTKDEEKWNKALGSLGIDLARFSGNSGHA